MSEPEFLQVVTYKDGNIPLDQLKKDIAEAETLIASGAYKNLIVALFMEGDPRFREEEATLVIEVEKI